MRRAEAQRYVQNAAAIAYRDAGSFAVFILYRLGGEVKNEARAARKEHEGLFLGVIRRGYAARRSVKYRVRYIKTAGRVIRRDACERERDGVVHSDEKYVFRRRSTRDQCQQHDERENQREDRSAFHARRLPS